MNGGAGDDTMDGGADPDTLSGGDGDDTLAGAYGNDTVRGNGDDDALSGNGGADTLIGGTGADAFIYWELADSGIRGNRDTIQDFSRAEGDRIDLVALDADAGTPGADDAFAFIGTAAFGGVAGQLRFQASGANTLVQADVDGNGSADFAILLVGTTALTAADFVL